MRRFLMMMAASLCAAAMWAQSSFMTITSVGGETSVFELDSSTVADYAVSKDGSQYVIVFKTGAFTYVDGVELPDVYADNPGQVLLEIPVTSVAGVEFSGEGLGIKDLNAKDNLMVDLSNQVLKFRNVANPTQLVIATVEGLVKDSQVITADMEINLKQYGPGFLVIKAGNRTFKIMVR